MDPDTHISEIRRRQRRLVAFILTRRAIRPVHGLDAHAVGYLDSWTDQAYGPRRENVPFDRALFGQRDPMDQ